QLRRDVVVRDRAGGLVAEPERDVVRRLLPTDARPRPGLVAGERVLGERPSVGLQAGAAVDGARAAQVVAGLRAGRGQGEVGDGLRAAVVVHDDLAQVQLRRDV